MKKLLLAAIMLLGMAFVTPQVAVPYDTTAICITMTTVPYNAIGATKFEVASSDELTKEEWYALQDYINSRVKALR